MSVDGVLRGLEYLHLREAEAQLKTRGSESERGKSRAKRFVQERKERRRISSKIPGSRVVGLVAAL